MLHTGVGNWQQLDANLPPETDLLLLDQQHSGLQQIGEHLSHQAPQRGYGGLMLVLPPGQAGCLELGSDRLHQAQLNGCRDQLSQWSRGLQAGAPLTLVVGGTPADQQALEPLLQELAALTHTEAQLAAAPVDTAATAAAAPATSTPVSIGPAAPELLAQARADLQRALQARRLQAALVQAYGDTAALEVEPVLQLFLKGELEPQLHWARMEADGINGAFVASHDLILVNQQLAAQAGLQRAVVLEELGHWLEQRAGLLDSVGDEGQRLAVALLGQSLSRQSREGTDDDHSWLQVGDARVAAELSTNDPPTSTNDALTLNEDTTTTLSVADFGSYADPNSDPLAAIKLTTLPTNGLLEFNNGTGWINVTLNQVISKADLDNSKLRYTPATNSSGSTYDTIGYEVSDGALYSTSAYTLTLSVTAINDRPVQTGTAPTPISILEDSANTTAVPLGMASLNYGPGGGSDESTQTLTYTITEIPSFIGLFKADGITAVSLNNTLTLSELQGLTYKTIANANGSGNLSWSVQDNGGTDNGGVASLSQSLAITVTAVNDAPIASGSATLAPIPEDFTSPTGTTVFSLFSARFNDSADSSSSSTANSLIGVVITANAATSSQGQWQWLNNSTWTNIATTGLSDSAGLFLTTATSIRFFPAPNFNGSPGALTTRLVDSSASSPTNGSTISVSTNGGTTPYSAASVSLSTSVSAVNDAPTFTTVALITGAVEDSFKEISYADLAVITNAADIEGDALSFRIDTIAAGSTLEKWSGTAWSAVNPGSTFLAVGEKLQWKAAANANGTLNAFSLSAYDGALASAAPVQLQVSVEAVNDLPVVSGASKTVGQGATLSFVAADFSFTDADSAGSGDTGQGKSLQAIKITALPANGTLWLDANGDGSRGSDEAISLNQEILSADLSRLRFTPNGNFSGSTSFSWNGSDGLGYASSAVSTTISVTALADRAPQLSSSTGRTLVVRPTAGGAVTTPVVIDAGLRLVDPDAAVTNLASYDTIYSVTLTVVDQTNGAFVAGDTLAATAGSGISVSYDSSTGVLKLSGDATAAAYQQLLRAVTFATNNTSNDNQRNVNVIVSASIDDTRPALHLDGVDDYIETLRPAVP
ncbi:MAG: DUF4347 domain-containing protein, partial [Cyanobacteria bacterium K_DeepCast_150m_m2_101]|nr:DUF4347 domain-containing protein [Cyanobacteria bacterium K_DeepCast_150m_m2_101]